MKKNILIDLAAMLLGCALLAAALDIFILSNHFSPGGVSGLAASVSEFVPLTIGTISLLINAPLMIGAWRVLGFKQLSRTLIATVLLSVLIDGFALLLPTYTGNPLLAATFGGALAGAGLGVLLLRGISTGGTDLLSILIVRAVPNWPVGKLLLAIDTAVVLIAVLVYRDVEIALYSFVVLFVCSKMIDAIIDGANYAKVIYIVTSRGEEMCRALNTKTFRGSTLLQAKGSFTGEDKAVIFTVTRKNALSQTLALIRMTDPEAFSFVLNAAEVHGEGFRKYRADAMNS
ncbi:MAG: YitT family protein [Oscillospiraceae bacterium]|nr:YitT family protein [Oscillospiraceae bacterium]